MTKLIKQNIVDFEKKLSKSPGARKDLMNAKKMVAESLIAKYERKMLEAKEIEKQISLKGRKKFIEDSITAYRAWHNAEYIEHLKYIRKLRKIQINDYAATPDKEFRLLFKLPSELYFYLNRFLKPAFPENEKESIWFAKKYKEFCVAEKI